MNPLHIFLITIPILVFLAAILALLNDDKQKKHETLTERNQRVIAKYTRIIGIILIFAVFVFFVMLILGKI